MEYEPRYEKTGVLLRNSLIIKTANFAILVFKTKEIRQLF